MKRQVHLSGGLRIENCLTLAGNRCDLGCVWALNLGASSMVALSLLSEFNLASLLIQTAWIIISLFGLGRHALKAHRKRPGALTTIQLLNDQ